MGTGYVVLIFFLAIFVIAGIVVALVVVKRRRKEEKSLTDKKIGEKKAKPISSDNDYELQKKIDKPKVGKDDSWKNSSRQQYKIDGSSDTSELDLVVDIQSIRDSAKTNKDKSSNRVKLFKEKSKKMVGLTQ